MRIRLSNWKDEKRKCFDDIDNDESNLAKHVREKAMYRCITFNDGNVRLNNVMGTASGTVGACIASKGSSLLAFKLDDGECLTSSAIIPNRRDDDVGFHQKAVTCLSYCGSVIVSGSLDCTVRLWDASEFTMEVLPQEELDRRGVDGVTMKAPLPPKSRLLFTGHTRGISAVKATELLVASAAADMLLILWCPRSGAVFRQIKGFDMSVLTINFHEGSMSCGCADGLVRVWSLNPTARNPVGGLRPLYSNVCEDEGPISAVCHTSMEVLCGHRSGKVSSWSLVTEESIFVVQPHALAISCMQMDSVKVVTASFDGYIKVSAPAHCLG